MSVVSTSTSGSAATASSSTNYGWWRSWRTSQWHLLRSHCASALEVSHAALSDVINSDINFLNRIRDDVRRLKEDLLQLRQWEEGRNSKAPPPPPLSTLVNDAGADPRATSGSNSGRRSTMPDDERQRRREMARKVGLAADKIKQENRRRIEQIRIVEDTLRRNRMGEGTSASASRGIPPTEMPSPQQSSPAVELPQYFAAPQTEASGSSTTQPDESSMYRSAWARYINAWDDIAAKRKSSPRSSPPTQYTFSTFPWPTVTPPQSLPDLNKTAIALFITHGPPKYRFTSRKDTKTALHEAVRRWHPDRSLWISRVAEPDKEVTKKGAGIVIRVLNEMSAEQ